MTQVFCCDAFVIHSINQQKQWEWRKDKKAQMSPMK